MAKSSEQRAWEARQWAASQRRVPRGIAHPATPNDDGGLWHTPCERAGCEQTFVTKAKQRRYCSDECRRMVERQRARLLEYRSQQVTVTCAAPDCGTVFVRARTDHRYCSRTCGKRTRRNASHFTFSHCVECGVPLPVLTARARYCGAICRVRANRRKQHNEMEHTR